MKYHRALFIAAVVSLTIGFALLNAAAHPGPYSIRGQETIRIPDGTGWHSLFELEMSEGGSVSVEFREISNGRVNLYLLNHDDYEVYQDTGLVPRPLGSTSGSSGLLQVDIPSEGTYYLVFGHGGGYEATPQDVHVDYVFSGLLPTGPDRDIARTGFVLVIVGAAIANIGVVVRFREKGKKDARA